MKNPHEVLQVGPNVSREELDSAFRSRAKDLHPDRNPGDPEATHRFRELLAAYELLKQHLDQRQGPADNEYSFADGSAAFAEHLYQAHIRRSRPERRPVKQTLKEAAILGLVVCFSILIILYIIWANTKTDWIPGCC